VNCKEDFSQARLFFCIQKRLEFKINICI